MQGWKQKTGHQISSGAYLQSEGSLCLGDFLPIVFHMVRAHKSSPNRSEAALERPRGTSTTKQELSLGLSFDAHVLSLARATGSDDVFCDAHPSRVGAALIDSGVCERALGWRRSGRARPHWPPSMLTRLRATTLAQWIT